MNKKCKILSILMALIFSIGCIGCGAGVNTNEKNTQDEITKELKKNKFEYMDRLFNKDKVINIDIKMDKASWNDMLKNASEDEMYYSADITSNGETFHNVGIKPKGSASLSAVKASDKSDRFSFKIKTDKFVDNQKIYGLSKFVLNNNIGDATSMKEYFSYDMLNDLGVPTPGYAYANITLNGEPWGLYLAVESLEKSFIKRNFKSKNGNLYKIEDVPVPEGQLQEYGDSLKYKNDDIESYPNIFKNAVFKKTTKEDNKRLIQIIKNLNEGTDLEECLDVKEILKYFAVNTYTVNLDSYACCNKHNYLLYEENGKLDIIPWDYNVSFGGFGVRTSRECINFPIDKPIILDTMENSPLIDKLISVPEYKEKYHKYLKKLVEGYASDKKFAKRVEHVDSLIGEYVKNDPTGFYTYDEYKNAIENFKKYASDRNKSIIAQLEGSQPSTEYGDIEPEMDLFALGDQCDLPLGTVGNRGVLNDVNMKAFTYIGVGQLLRALSDEEAVELYEELNLTPEQIEMINKSLGV